MFNESHFQKKKLKKKIFIQIVYWKIYAKKIQTLISPYIKPPKTYSVKRKQTKHVFAVYKKNRVITRLPEKQDGDEVGGICHKWDIYYDNELEMNINR